MSDYPKASIIIVNYNGKDFITDCLNSVLKTDYPNYEVVVVDNGSTDGSFELLTEEYSELDQVNLVRSDKNLYFTGGSNLGAKNSDGEKLVFLNSDTEVKSDWLSNLIKCHINKGKKSLVQPKILLHNNKEIIDNVGGKYVFPGFGLGIGRGEKDKSQYDQLAEIDYANGTCFLIDKNFFFNLGGFDDWFKLHYEDVDLNLRAKRQEAKAFVCLKSVIYHKESLTIKKEIKSNFLLYHIRKNRLQTISKNFSGISKLARYIVLLPYYIYWIIAHPITLKFIFAFLNHQLDYLFNLFRFRELKALIKKDKFRLLDLGCGEGTLIKIAKKQNIEAVGVDLNPPPDNRIIDSNVESLNLNKKFDAVTLYHVIEHLNDPQKGINVAKKHLKSNGLIVIETPLIGNLSNKFLGENYFAYFDQTHRNLMTKKELVSLVKESGLKIRRQGITGHEFPLTLITSSFKQSLVKGFISLVSFIPIKIVNIIKNEPNIIRIYCQLMSQPAG